MSTSSNKPSGAGDLEQISQRLTRASALLGVITAAARHKDEWDLAEALEYLGRDLDDIDDAANAARRALEPPKPAIDLETVRAARRGRK